MTPLEQKLGDRLEALCLQWKVEVKERGRVKIVARGSCLIVDWDLARRDDKDLFQQLAEQARRETL
jgi:hypothetical protein